LLVRALPNDNGFNVEMRHENASRQLLFLELNEINFGFVQRYAAAGRLPNFARLIARHGVAETTSEERCEQLEPWIQWVTAHTGRAFAEHGVFRLGDIVERDIPQVWEILEGSGVLVGAISPMNAKYRLKAPAFFVPDPWTPTQIVARPVLTHLYRALVQAVNDNAARRATLGSAAALLAGLLWYASPQNYLSYVRMAASSFTKPWRRAMFLDQLLGDVFVKEVTRTRPQFATLFLNAGAHIQHHYMFCAAPYEGPHRNPQWYVKKEFDPICEVYETYDRIIGRVQEAFPRARLMLATGLHQEPHEQLTFYWRLKDHAAFLRRIGVPFTRVEPRMSRDFLVVCENEEEAHAATQRLESAVAFDGTPLFEVDNRGRDLFVMLTYPREIGKDFTFSAAGMERRGLSDEVAFVALKNGEHNGIGYFLDTGADGPGPATFPLTEVPSRIFAALNVSPSAA
jgi:hypothetical protein